MRRIEIEMLCSDVLSIAKWIEENKCPELVHALFVDTKLGLKRDTYMVSSISEENLEQTKDCIAMGIDGYYMLDLNEEFHKDIQLYTFKNDDSCNIVVNGKNYFASKW